MKTAKTGVELVIGPVELGPRTKERIMNLHTIEACIGLAEAIPRDAGNYRVLDELLIELRHLAKKAENQA